MRNKPTIALFTTGEGHQSISEALEEILQHEYTVETFFYRDHATMNLYGLFYQYIPFGFKVPYLLSQNKYIIKTAKQLFQKKYSARLRRFLNHTQPMLCISTYFMFTWAIEALREESHFPLLNVVTDPRTIHPMLISPTAEGNFLFDQTSLNVSRSFEPNAHYLQSGWFVREKFQESYDLRRVRRQLNLDPDTFTITIAAGSEGTHAVSTIFPSLLNAQQPVQVVVACGGNSNLLRTSKAMAEMARTMQSPATIHSVAFTKEMHRYMQAADLVVGKAGPNTLFEAVATKTPFLAITHIAGQEDGNLDIIREYSLGYVEENPFKAGTLLQDIIANPDQLTVFQPHLEKMAAHNRHAAAVLRAAVADAVAAAVAK